MANNTYMYLPMRGALVCNYPLWERARMQWLVAFSECVQERRKVDWLLR